MQVLSPSGKGEDYGYAMGTGFARLGGSIGDPLQPNRQSKRGPLSLTAGIEQSVNFLTADSRRTLGANQQIKHRSVIHRGHSSIPAYLVSYVYTLCVYPESRVKRDLDKKSTSVGCPWRSW